MSEPNDRELDLLLGEHFAGELDRHVGSSQRVFAQTEPTARANRILRWLIPGAIGAMAASLVVAVVVLSGGRRGPIASPIDDQSGTTNPAQVESSMLERAVAWQAIDEGPALLGQDLPVRRVRQQVLQRVRWHDPQLNTTIEMTVPRERIIYIEMESY